MGLLLVVPGGFSCNQFVFTLLLAGVSMGLAAFLEEESHVGLGFCYCFSKGGSGSEEAVLYLRIGHECALRPIELLNS